jgi:transcriptional regulator with PAS, ATPase and Fis domain
MEAIRVGPNSKLQTELGFYGNSPEVEEILGLIQTIAPTDLSVLIVGESGTGKELVARAIHALSKRAKKPLISVNTGAIPEGILESELFGHVKGSFTGAIGQKKGYFEAADQGTIFLDEIGEMSINTQVKLLRVLEESEIMRVGDTNTFRVNVRLIAATNKNLETAVQKEEFRRDLYYRLKAITIVIPPLRKRNQDIPLLINKVIENYSKSQNIGFKGFSPDAVDLMKEYHWPGNVWELRNFVETALILNKGEVVTSKYVSDNLGLRKEEHASTILPVPLNLPQDKAEREIIYRTLLSLKMDIAELKSILLNNNHHQGYQLPLPQPESDQVLDEKALKPSTISGMEREMIKDTLNKYGGSRRKAARALQISERTLYRKIKEYGL